MNKVEIERDRYGRPLVKPPTGKKLVPYTRATTIANSLDDASALTAWKMRMAAIGLTVRSDLLLAISAAQEDKMAINKYIEDAMEVAGASRAATREVKAKQAITDAEKELSKAREQAIEDLQQIGFESEDAAIAEQRAALELEKAREALARVSDLPPNSRARKEAELAFAQADLNY